MKSQTFQALKVTILKDHKWFEVSLKTNYINTNVYHKIYILNKYIYIIQINFSI